MSKQDKIQSVITAYNAGLLLLHEAERRIQQIRDGLI